METNWYHHLKCKLEITAAGIVAATLHTFFSGNQFQKLPATRDLDSNIEKDVTQWFNGSFNPWFSKLSAGLTVNNTVTELTASSYLEKINSIITALFVARTYYAKQADSSYITSLKSVALYKAAMCEELAKAIGAAYQYESNKFGCEIIEKTSISTIASTYEGSGPVNYKWDGEYLVNHFQYKKTGVMEETKDKKTKDYLPWVISAGFFLIAWSAAAAKKAIT